MAFVIQFQFIDWFPNKIAERSSYRLELYITGK